MPIQFGLEGNVGLFRVSGELRKTELKQVQQECEAEIQKIGKIKILIILDNFHGWEKGVSWSDWAFAERNDANILKFAIVGGEKWKDSTYAFLAKGLRPMPIEFFTPSQQAEAREWLSLNE